MMKNELFFPYSLPLRSLLSCFWLSSAVMSYKIHPFCSDVILMRFVSRSFLPWSGAFVDINNTSVFCLAFPNIAVGFSTALNRYFARHRCWYRNFQLPTSGFHCELELSVVWFDEEYPSHCLALSSFGFSIAHLCFAFFFAASDIQFHISGHTSSGREVVCFLVSLLPDRVYPSGGLSFNKLYLKKPVHASDNSLSPSTFQ